MCVYKCSVSSTKGAPDRPEPAHGGESAGGSGVPPSPRPDSCPAKLLLLLGILLSAASRRPPAGDSPPQQPGHATGHRQGHHARLSQFGHGEHLSVGRRASPWGALPPPPRQSFIGEVSAPQGMFAQRRKGFLRRGGISCHRCSVILGVLLGKSEVKTCLPYCLSVTDP